MGSLLLTFFTITKSYKGTISQLNHQPLKLNEIVGPFKFISWIISASVSLKTCQDSAPGMDGIPYSFYSVFGEILLPSLLNSWQYALRSNQLAQSHAQSCITLLPKKNKDLKIIQNWRPISLSPCDLKLVTKIYARRLNSILPQILSESQAAYVQGRDISFNNRLLRTAQ